MFTKEIFGGLSVLFGVAGSTVYLWQVYRRTVKPHVFSWIIWGILTFIGFIAQYVTKAGPGCWSIGVISFFNFVIAGAAFFHGEKSITRSDWAAFIFAISAIPVWVATNNPLWAVVIVSFIDAVALYPTLRKSWENPHEEGAAAFLLGEIQFILSIAALENYTLTTVLYPAAIVMVNTSLILTLLYRRRQVPA